MFPCSLGRTAHSPACSPASNVASPRTARFRPFLSIPSRLDRRRRVASVFRLAAASSHTRSPAPEPRSMARNCSPSSPPVHRRLPVLLFDVMDTIVRDPFYHEIPAFFNMSMKELLESKHPTAWVEFEMGLIDEIELAKKFFKDGRPFDLEGENYWTQFSNILSPREKIKDAGLKECMVSGYSYVDGIEALLNSLKQNKYELHAFTNYPIWYMLIEKKLKLSKYLSWTFCSCTIGKRKPAPDFYTEVLHLLGVEPANCIFIDDRIANVDAAANAGMIGLHFKNAYSLKHDLSLLGVELVAQDN